MQAGRYNILARQGKTFSFVFAIKTNGQFWDLTSYSARMQVRPSAVSSTKYLDLVSPTNISLTDEGQVTISVTAENMADIPFGTHVYDIELVSAANEVYPVLEGKFAVRQEVTR
jgi:hypothetical protein